MRHYFTGSCCYLAAVTLFFSCAITPAARGPAEPSPEYPPEYAPEHPPAASAPQRPEPPAAKEEPARPETPERTEAPARVEPEGPAPVRPEIPAIPEYIMGRGLTTADHLADFLLNLNAEAERRFTEELAVFYVEEAAIEGVNHDMAFAQMCLETGFLRYGGLVTPDMNNFCGLGALGPGQRGERFPDPRTGVRAHIQHLKGYATDEPLRQELVDPRYRWIRYGSSPAIKGLTGTWATDREYADKINSILRRLYRFSFEAGKLPGTEVFSGSL
jgi:hypothetical protein